VLAVATAFVTGCERKPADQWEASAGPARVCADLRGQRVDDDRCNEPHVGVGSSPFLWYYLGTLNRPTRLPPYGAMVGGGSYSPAPGVFYRDAPVRGGFGGFAERLGHVFRVGA